MSNSVHERAPGGFHPRLQNDPFDRAVTENSFQEILPGFSGMRAIIVLRVATAVSTRRL